MDRFALELPAWISIIDESGEPQTFEAVTKNICAGGAFFRTEQSLTVGTAVKMNLILSLYNILKTETISSRIDVSGSIIRKELEGIAVCFDDQYQIMPVAG